MKERYEAVVVGGGLAGLAAAVVVSRSGLSTLHVAPKGPEDRRTSALMMPSVGFLQAAGLVDRPDSLGHALTQIRIIDATDRLIRAPETLFDSREAGLAAFGWNLSNTALAQSFAAARALTALAMQEASLVELEQAPEGGMRLTFGDGNIVDTALLVGADGKKSLIRSSAGFRARENGFTQAALVADLQLGRPLGGTSIEFHYPNGPFTLVPAGDHRANLVWIDDRAVLRSAQEGGREHLRRLFAVKSQRLFGDVQLLTGAHMFPLSTITVDRAGKNGVVLVGEAAHAFPPIGAQGLNLGLRDVADLAAVLAGTDTRRPDWAREVSDAFAQRRAGDLARTGGMVDALFHSLLSDFLPAQAMRAGGLWALKLVPQLRRRAFALGMGESGLL